ncbi:MAG TPA: hypothetical protein VGF25_23850 [Thermoleophilaceae bacterium]|jgi:hypothetical protein
MSYALENALFQWQEGERRLDEASGPARADLERAAEEVLDELRRRLGSRFVLDELVEFYSDGTDWAIEPAARYAGGTDAAWVVDAAFGRYAREASNFAGGRAREQHERP